MEKGKIFLIPAALVAALLLTACTWVKPTPQGENVRLLTAAEVVRCERIGETTVSLLATVATIQRNPRKVQQELNTLARNGAADIGGDTVVAVGPPIDGKQTFTIYRCMPR